MRKACLLALIAVAFLLGIAMRGEADDAKTRPSDAEVRGWIDAVEASGASHKIDLLRKLSDQSDRTIPLMYERIRQLGRLKPTLIVCDVRDIRAVVRPRLSELEALLTTPSITWYGDGKLIVRSTRQDFDKVGTALDRIRAASMDATSK